MRSCGNRFLPSLPAKGRFTFKADAFSPEEQSRWARLPDAIDLWVQFFHTEVIIQEYNEDNPGGSDECQKLIQRLLTDCPELEMLRGKVLRTTILEPDQGTSVSWPGLEMSPYTITIVER